MAGGYLQARQVDVRQERMTDSVAVTRWYDPGSGACFCVSLVPLRRVVGMSERPVVVEKGVRWVRPSVGEMTARWRKHTFADAMLDNARMREGYTTAARKHP